MILNKIKLVVNDNKHLLEFIKNKLRKYPRLFSVFKVVVNKSPWLNRILISKGVMSHRILPSEHFNKLQTPKQAHIYTKLVGKKFK
nr:hypothetical protein BCU42_09080 [Vibrio splendidus]